MKDQMKLNKSKIKGNEFMTGGDPTCYYSVLLYLLALYYIGRSIFY